MHIRTPLIPALLAIVASLSIDARAAAIDTAEALARAVAAARPGDEVLIAPGRYDGWQLELAGKGSADAPIIVRPAEPDTVVFTGATKILLTGSHITVQGLAFGSVTAEKSGGVFFFDGARHCRLTDTQFIGARMENLAVLVWFRHGASDNRIDHCTFRDNQYRCIRVYFYDDFSLQNGPPLRNRIDHNRFIDGPKFGGNGGETIQIGNGAPPYSDLRPQTLVENNVFLRCNGEAEIISNKSSANTIRRNLFVDCDGMLVIRQGTDCLIEDNVFINGHGGIRVSGRGHRVIGNRIHAPRTHGIVLQYGTSDEGHPAAYMPVSGCTIEGNVIEDAGETGIFIGTLRNKSWRRELWAQPPYNGSADLVVDVAPHDNVIRNNVVVGRAGALIEHDHAPDNDVRNNALIAREDHADRVLLDEDFAGGMDNWWVEGAVEARVEDGRFHLDADAPDESSGSTATAWCRVPLAGDVKLELDAHVVSSRVAANNINLFLFYSDSTGRPLEATAAERASAKYSLYHPLNGYIFTFVRDYAGESAPYAEDSRTARFRLRRCPGFTLLDEVFVGESRAGVTHRITALKLAGYVVVKVDGRAVVAARDDQPFDEGLLGLRTFRTRLWWDNIRVTQLADPGDR